MGQYEQQQQLNGHSPSSKAKKIQIVYIKVPLAKLKPSLSANDHSASSGNSNNTATYGANNAGRDASK